MCEVVGFFELSRRQSPKALRTSGVRLYGWIPHNRLALGSRTSNARHAAEPMSLGGLA
jgi:hypothetical protein